MTTPTPVTTAATPRFDRLRKVLAELFQFDQAELDFGIYRIMNAKREEITRFLDRDLLPQVQEELGKLAGGNRTEIEAKLKQEIEATLRYGGDPEKSPPVQELRRRLAAAADLSALEADIYNDLASFFKRYYQNGDFLSLRRYKKDVYAIPYEGEEVKLHWANADQYYVKSSEAFRDYTFHLPTMDGAEGRRVHFRLVDADTEANNNKAENGKERRFILANPPLLEENGELTVHFTYRLSGEKQAKLNADAAATILAQEGFDSWLAALRNARPTEKNLKRTLLEKQLTDYTSKNSFDYFIHKDLRGFLRRELDFFIKNEVLQLDDLETEGEARALAQLARVRAMRGVAHKIIEMLAQLENFQKKLWLKKKFVVSTDYCVTLDKLIENAPELLDEVARNEAQRREWVRLFAVDELKGDELGTTPGYSEPLTREFLEANPFLVLDTQFFDAAFKNKLLASFDDLDAQTDGLLVKSENFGALNLLQARYREQVKCIYIDPPYNTGGDGFAYKDNYQHSSWLSMLFDRLIASISLLTDDGVCFANIDDIELSNLLRLFESTLGTENFLATLARRTKSGGGSAASHFAVEHDYVVAWARDRTATGPMFVPHDPEYAKRYAGEDDKGKYFWDTMERSSTQTKPYPIEAPDGQMLTGKWFRSKDRFEQDLLIGDVRFVQKPDGDWSVQFKQRMAPGRKLRSLLAENRFKSRPEDLGDLGLGDQFSFPKPVELMNDIVQTVSFLERDTCTVLDYFAGSGTTGHAVINLNREDGGSRKYILVEMGEYFDSVLEPRIQKVIYSKDWKNGKPVSRDGSSQLVKVLRLESYEDALNNIEIKQPSVGAQPLDFSGDAMKGFREDYLLHYMLNVETRGSPSLLNMEAFRDPFAYELKIATSSAGETRPTRVDLVETFNYLLGLWVKTSETLQGFKVVTGTSPAGERVLVIWRNLEEKDNAALDAFFAKQKYNPRDMEFDLIYVNGDNNLQNLRREDETWKVRLIEEEFQRLMFDVRDV
jgi:adenine-specific DNA-methyltransferase